MPHKVRLKGCAEELASGVGLGESESLPGFSRRRRPSLRTPGQRRGPRPGRGLCSSRRASERARAANAPGRDPAARMTARGAAGRCPPTVSGGRGAGRGARGPARLGHELLGRCGRSEPTAPARRLPRLSRRGRGLQFPSHLCVRTAWGPGCARAGAALDPAAAPGAAALPWKREDCSPHCTEGHTEPPAGRREGWQPRAKARCQTGESLPFSLLTDHRAKRQAEGLCPEWGAFAGGHLPQQPPTYFQALLGSGHFWMRKV